MNKRALLVLACSLCVCVSAHPQSPTEKGLVSHWTFDPAHIEGSVVKPLVGTDAATIAGEIRFDRSPETLRLDGGTNQITITDRIAEAALPKQAFTVEAWAKVLTTQAWGAFLSAFQDDGPAEKGWMLGYRGDHMCFGLASQGADDGNGRMTYLTAKESFDLGEWTHVVGVYTGKEMQLYVNGERVATSKEQSGPVLYPDKAFYELGAYHDENENLRLKGSLLEVRLYDRALSGKDVRKNFSVHEALVPATRELALGPYLQFTGPDSAVVKWRTAKPMGSVLEYGLTGDKRRLEDTARTMEHAMALTGLKRNTLYRYRVVLPGNKKRPHSNWYELDTMFNYTMPPVPKGPSPYAGDNQGKRIATAAEYIMSRAGITKGHCVVLGCGTGQLAYELALRSDFHILGLDTDADVIAQARQALRKAGVYGTRVTVQAVESCDALPLTKYFANLVVSGEMITGGTCPGTAAEVYRILRPNGGTALLGTPANGAKQLKDWLDVAKLEHAITEKTGLAWASLIRPPLEGAGQWTHQYGSPDNSARSGDTLQGATSAKDLQVQWVGRPGPRAMVDRSPRKPSPLYANGRLFTQGHRRLIAQDVYNGAILWSMEIPELQRYNMPRDCSNWCVDDDFVYAALEGKCWRIDAATGRLEGTYDVVEPRKRGEFDWGYLAQVDDTLFGTAQKRDIVYTNIWGGAGDGWYDKPTGPVTYKVCSDSLFALAKDSGETRWTYADGVIINPTITIADGRVFFVECRNATVKASEDRRVGLKELWDDQFLVALDARTGEKVWEQVLNTADGIVVFYLLHANDTLVIALSGKVYRMYGFDAKNGVAKWEVNHPWTADNHSGHMQHPVVVGDTVFLEPRGYALATGALTTEKVGRHEGCATYAGTEGALIYRGTGRQTSMWDVENEQISTWKRLRPGCWLSTVAGAGMVLSPEGGGGCSCGNWMETSLALVRKDK